MKLSKILVLILSLAFTKAIAAPSNDELKIALTQEFESLNPLIAQMNATTYMLGAVSRAMATMDPNNKWYATYFKELPTLENKLAKISPDKKFVIATWEFKPTARWSDGKPMSCEDIQFTLKVAASDRISLGERESYTKIAKVEWDPKNPQKCTLTSDKLRWDFARLGTTYLLPKHLEEPIFEKYKDVNEGYEKNTNYTKNPSLPGLYNGPYMVSEVKLGSHVTMVPNPYFYGPAPKIKKLIFKLIPSTGTLEQNLRSGTVDLVSILGFTFDQALAFEKKTKAENLPFVNHFKQGQTFEHIDLNLDNPILKDMRVRKALVYAINREELVKALFEGKQTVALHNITPVDPWFTKDPKKIVLYPYDKKQAAKLLDEAGWKLDAGSGLRMKDGKKLSFQFNTTAGNKVREMVQTFLQGQWRQLGIEVSIKNEPARVFFAETTKKRYYDSLAMYAWISSAENNPRSTCHSAQIPNEKNGWSGQNYPGWSNAKVDEIIEKIDLEFNPKKRAELAHQLLKYYTDEVPVIPLYYRAELATVPKGLKNFRLTGHQFSDTNEAELWTF